MAETETLREYVVDVNYKVDSNTEQKFKASMRGASLEADLLARAIADVAKGIGESVLKIATSFDDLFFFGQRANTNVRNIQGLSYAFSQLGLSGQEAMASIQSVAAQLRTNPGVESWVNTIGVKTRDALGNLRDTVDVLADVNVALKRQPGGYAVASRQAAAILGIDENTFNVLQSHIDDLKAYREKYNAAAARMGVNPDDAAEKANRVMSSVRDLQMQLGLLADKLMQAFGPQLSDALDRLAKWVSEHSEDIKNTFEVTASAVLRIVNHLVDFVEKMAPVLKALDQFTYKIMGTGGIQSAFEALMLYVSGKWALGMIEGIAAVSTKLGPLILMLGALYAGFKLGGAIGSWIDQWAASANQPTVNGGSGWGDEPAPAPGLFQRGINKVRGWLGLPEVAVPKSGERTSNSADLSIPPEGRAFLDAIAGHEAPRYNVMYGGGTFTGHQHPNSPQPITSGPNAGRTSTAAGRYQFLFKTWDNLKNTLGLKDFGPKSQDQAAWYLAKKGYADATGRDLETDLKSGDPKVVAAAARAVSGIWTSLPGGIEQTQSASGFVQAYKAALDREANRPTVDAASATPLPPAPPLRVPSAAGAFNNPAPLASGPIDNSSSRSAMINQTNHITISGASDATATALSIEASQSRLNNSLLTNMKTAVQ